ncbi:MAG: methionine--tRNA ligase [Clostridiales bacterium]|nr:methionine--tRNA ligase [Clostridiales bacterium]
MAKKEKFYITTPLYYPSGKWHLGHSYTTVCCDAIARYKRLTGYDVFYLTGTDEHGQKIEERATLAGKTPKQFVDELVDDIKRLWALLDIKYDKFIRTTDDYHVKSVQDIFTKLYEQGDIYKATYKGKYCTPCESFWTPSQLVDGKCPDCGRDVIDAEEESYFFRLSKYKEPLKKLLTETDFLEPKSRVNEMVNNFLSDLNDLAVSRTSVKWGIPVPFDPKHSIYVWVDALSNYVNALGYNNGEENMDFWPADLHMVGKEIVRFHTIIWPAILMALGLPTPKKVYGHGWMLFGGDKMSKSKGNTADPFVLADRYGIDALRYYLLREIPFGSDGTYTDEAFLTRINADLVNDLGNLVKRTVSMANQYFGGTVGKPAAWKCDYTDMADALFAKVDKAMNKYSCSEALEEIFAFVSASNKYIDLTAPWALNKAGETAKLQEVIYNLLEGIRLIAGYLLPFIPNGAERIFKDIGIATPECLNGIKFGDTQCFKVGEGEVLYKRLDIKKELEELSAPIEEKPEEKKVEEKKEEKAEEVKKEISIDEFFNTQLKVAEVIACEKVEKADKLLKLTLKVGDETRTVVSGIAKSYTPEEMVGKQVVLVANLKPAKLRGIVSEGMVLCATDGDKVVLVSPERKVIPGSEVC